MACYGEAAAGIEGVAVGAGLGAGVAFCFLVAAGLEEDADAFAGPPLANAVAGDLGEDEGVVDPDGAFYPGEAGGDLLKPGAGGDEAIGGGIEPVEPDEFGAEDALRRVAACEGAAETQRADHDDGDRKKVEEGEGLFPRHEGSEPARHGLGRGCRRLRHCICAMQWAARVGVIGTSVTDGLENCEELRFRLCEGVSLTVD